MSKLLLSCNGWNIVWQALVLFGKENQMWKRSSISVSYCTCMHPLKNVLLWVSLCTMTRDEDEDCRDLQKRIERRVLGASLLTAFVGSVIGFTQTSGCPLLAGDPDARWKSPARSGADPEVP